MASICAKLMTEKLFDIKEIFTRLQPEKMYDVMEDGLLLMIDQIFDEVANDYMPGTWKRLPTG